VPRVVEGGGARRAASSQSRLEPLKVSTRFSLRLGSDSHNLEPGSSWRRSSPSREARVDESHGVRMRTVDGWTGLHDRPNRIAKAGEIAGVRLEDARHDRRIQPRVGHGDAEMIRGDECPASRGGLDWRGARVITGRPAQRHNVSGAAAPPQ
jgi:hypothetical protein